MSDDTKRKTAAELAAEQAERELKNSAKQQEDAKKRAEDAAEKHAAQLQAAARQLEDVWYDVASAATQKDGVRFAVIAKLQTGTDKLPESLQKVAAEAAEAKFTLEVISDHVWIRNGTSSQTFSDRPSGCEVAWDWTPTKGGGMVPMRGWYPGSNAVPVIPDSRPGSVTSTKWLIARWDQVK